MNFTNYDLWRCTPPESPTDWAEDYTYWYKWKSLDKDSTREWIKENYKRTLGSKKIRLAELIDEHFNEFYELSLEER